MTFVPRRLLTRPGPLSDAWNITGGLIKTTKLPGYSYSLDPLACQKGMRLASGVGDSPCTNCYAMRGWYMVGPAAAAIQRRTQAIYHSRWVWAMTKLINHYCQPPLIWFRWHDAGDLQASWHLQRIMTVARRTPHVHHWLATREYWYVQECLEWGLEIPSNLMIRLSADRKDQPPDLPYELRHFYTSTVHRYRGRPVEIDPEDPSLTVECRAGDRGQRCGPCRACWSKEVQNVSYPEH